MNVLGRPVFLQPAQRGARGMRVLVTTMLAGMAALFIAATGLTDLHPAWGFVRAFAEAAMVGGIADWFAVTALFRHPLGIPIPHTAIIPARKDRIGRSLGNFVQNNFLSRDIIAARLENLRLGERAARWLAEPEHARK